MPVMFYCPSCHVSGSAPEALADKQAKCPNCGTALLVPAPPPVANGPARVEPAGEPWVYTFLSTYALLGMVISILLIVGTLSVLGIWVLINTKDTHEGAVYAIIFFVFPAAMAGFVAALGLVFFTAAILLAVDIGRNTREMRRAMEGRPK